MEYLVGIALIIVVIIIIGLLLRRRMYSSVDRLELWKDEIADRNVAAELSQMKELNLFGETLQSFNKWTKRWDAIVTEDLQKVRSLLLKSEILTDRYRFSSARENLATAESKLKELDEEIDILLAQINELLELEKSNRKRIGEINLIVESMEENISENEELYGNGKKRFKLEFEKIENKITNYSNFVKAGEYYQAKKVIDQINREIKRVQKELEEYPDIYEKCKVKLPEELEELASGIKEMKDAGYPVESLGYEKVIKDHVLELLKCVETIEEKDLESGKEIIPKIEASIQKMYDSLEVEVEARKYIETDLPKYRESLRDLEKSFDSTHNKILTLKEIYYFSEEDIKQFHRIDKKIEKLETEEIDLLKKLDKKTKKLSKLQIQLQDIFIQLEKVQNEYQSFDEYVNELRKNEIEAHETIETLEDQRDELLIKLKASNLPGVPEFIWDILKEAKRKSDKVISKLSETPLDMKAIGKALSDAKENLHIAEEQVDLIIEQADLTERVIQYANRYRSSNQEVAKSLIEAEHLFRSYEYELALETATSALELVEPGALKYIKAQ